MKILTVAAVAGLAACSMSASTPSGYGPEPVRGERAQRTMAALLDGKVPGPPRACLNSWEARRMTVVDDDTLLFRVNRNLVFRNDPGSCRGLGMGRALVIRGIGGSLCRGEIARVVDQQTGIETGGCVLSDFVPYRSRRRS